MFRSARFIAATCLLVLMAVGWGGCAPKSLVQEKYAESEYAIGQPLPDSLSKNTVEFMVFGDSQTGWRAEHRFYRSENWWTWRHLMFPFYQFYLFGNAFIGAANYYRAVPDYGTWSREFMSDVMLEQARNLDADFFLFLGDAVDDGRRADHWGYFLDDYGQILRNYPFLPVPGNHEFSNDSLGWANYQAVFERPRFYVQDLPQAAFFMLNSNYIVDQHGILDDDQQDRLWEKWFVSADTSTDRSWLERQLEKRKKRPFKFVALHHPLVSFSWHLEDWYEPVHGRNLLEKRTQLLNLLQQYNVQVIFSGHEHVYEHNTLRYNWGNPNATRIHQIISSGGGTPPRKIATPSEMDRRRQLYEEQGMDVVPHKQESVFHYSTVELSPEQMVISTYRVRQYPPHRVSLLDRITIPRPEWAGPVSTSSDQPSEKRP